MNDDASQNKTQGFRYGERVRAHDYRVVDSPTSTTLLQATNLAPSHMVIQELDIVNTLPQSAEALENEVMGLD